MALEYRVGADRWRRGEGGEDQLSHHSVGRCIEGASALITSSQRTRNSVGHAYGADAKRIAVSPKGVNTRTASVRCRYEHHQVGAMVMRRLYRGADRSCRHSEAGRLPAQSNPLMGLRAMARMARYSACGINASPIASATSSTITARIDSSHAKARIGRGREPSRTTDLPGIPALSNEWKFHRGTSSQARSRRTYVRGGISALHETRRTDSSRTLSDSATCLSARQQRHQTERRTTGSSTVEPRQLATGLAIKRGSGEDRCD